VVGGPRFVDHHVHLLRVAAGTRRPYELTTPASIAAYHRDVASRGSTPMDEPPDEPAHAGGDLVDALRAGLQRAADLGLVGVTEAGMSDWSHWDALLTLRERDGLAVDVRVLVASGAARDIARVVDAAAANDARLGIAGVKLYADGWLGPRTCACSEPFVDSDHRGVLFLDAAELAERVGPLAAAGLRPATHAIGDRAIEAVLDAYESVYGGADGCRAARPRIEHAQLLRPEHVDRIAELGVVTCIQPCFASSDAESFARGVPPGAFPDAYRWDRLVAAGAKVIAGSDFPIETLDPAVGLEHLTSGQHPLDRDTALRVMTVPLDDT
jgi:predicted amidohydrolase YtcJ